MGNFVNWIHDFAYEDRNRGGKRKEDEEEEKNKQIKWKENLEARSSSSYSPKNWRPTIDIDFTRKEILRYGHLPGTKGKRIYSLNTIIHINKTQKKKKLNFDRN